MLAWLLDVMFTAIVPHPSQHAKPRRSPADFNLEVLRQIVSILKFISFNNIKKYIPSAFIYQALFEFI